MIQKWTELKEELDKSIIIFGDLNIPLLMPNSKLDRKNAKDIKKLNVRQIDLTDIYKIFTTAEFTFFSKIHGTFTKIDCMLNCETILNKFKGLKSCRVYHLTRAELNLKSITK